MGARPLTGVVWLAASVAAITMLGCALTLDYGPPNPVRLDGSFADGGARDGATSGTCDAGCDDGLRCTADRCASGQCVHTNLCATGTDCVARSLGLCRRPCTSAADCNDGITCTADTCDATDAHCAHASTCQAPRVICLDNSVCVPDHCTSDTECSDGDACDGVEHCESGTCRPGSAVTCPASMGCAISRCDPTTGGCVRRLDASMCVDAHSCTIDACGTDGQCVHTPNDAACATPNRCVVRTCRPDTAIDPSGCLPSGGTNCASSLCGAGVCVPTTGTCNFDASCPAGQVCGATGCRHPSLCSSDAQCATTLTMSGCGTTCQGGQCLGVTCAPATMGQCGVIDVDATRCPRDRACAYVPSDALCADSDPSSTDVCDPSTFMCRHTCPVVANSCVHFTYVGSMCVPQLDPNYCTTTHGAPTPSDCAAWTCLGLVATGDGCVAVPSNAVCNDNATCTDDVCTLHPDQNGSCSNPPAMNAAMICNDLLACTHDACDPGNTTAATGCTHTPDDALCTPAGATFSCARPYCAQVPASAGTLGPLPTGCALEYQPTQCMPGQICSTDGMCMLSLPCTVLGSTCDDGNPCNGLEVCDRVTRTCMSGLPLSCPAIGSCVSVCTPTGCVSPIGTGCVP